MPSQVMGGDGKIILCIENRSDESGLFTLGSAYGKELFFRCRLSYLNDGCGGH